MKIFKLKVENYRLLKDFCLDIEEDLSLVVGKNNTGKTSLLTVLDKFLNYQDKSRFTFDDFNIEFKKELKRIVEDKKEIQLNDFTSLSIKLKIFIEYFQNDNLSNVYKTMMDLDPDNNFIVLSFEYSLSHEKYITLRNNLKDFKKKEEEKKKQTKGYVPKSFNDYMRVNHSLFFKINKKTIGYNVVSKKEDESVFIDLIKEGISTKEIINFKFISAGRGLNNKGFDKTLSSQTSRLYESSEMTQDQDQEIELFKDGLSRADADLTAIYKSLFGSAVEKVKNFGGIKLNDSEIEIISTLQHRELLEGNTTVVYKHDADNQLPEHYNGLGYMNLINIIFEIEILLKEFQKSRENSPSDLNLLFIEEPEVHTHPQMQYIFIKNIKKLLKDGIKREDGQNRKLQYIISTHSSHIVADSDFDDIKYLKRENNDGVIAKNLTDLKLDYQTEPNEYKFLKQYLTISRAEIFFAEKAILIEGDTERMLIPVIMHKIDKEEYESSVTSGNPDPFLPLHSQNISLLEVGNYSQIFEKFIDFLGIKSLLITDLDAVDAAGEGCEVCEGVDYSNQALKFFFGKIDLNTLKGYKFSQKLFKKDSKKWKLDLGGRLSVAFQTMENGYHARSFEDSFIQINRDFIINNASTFKSLKNVKHFSDTTKNAYFLAGNCIKKKTHFALDIMFNSEKDFSNWNIPAYIKEGLLWIKKD